MLSVYHAYVAWLIFMSVWPPILIAIAGWIISRDIRMAMKLWIFAVAVYQCGNMMSYFWTFGAPGFTCGTSMCILYGAFLFRACEKGRWVHVGCAGIVLGALLWLHQLAMFPAAVVSVAVLVVQRRVIFTGLGWLRLLVAWAIAFVIVWPWVAELLTFMDIRQACPDKDEIASGWKYMIMDFFSDRAYTHPFDRRALFHVVLVLAGYGAYRAWRLKNKAVNVFVLSGLGLLICGYSFPYLTLPYFGALKDTCPYRFILSAKMFLLIPAAWGLFELVSIVKQADRNARVAVACLALALAPSISAYCIDFIRRPATTGLADAEKEVVAWFGKQDEPRGRIIAESARLSAVLPYFMNCEMLSGPLADSAMIKHGWANVRVGGPFDGSFGRKTESLTARELRDHLMLDNVQYVACSGLLADKMELIKDDYPETARIGKTRVFAANPSRLNWLAGATNTVRLSAGPNRIRIEDAPTGSFDIKYHYWPTLCSSWGTDIKPVSLMDDPVPFIRVNNLRGRKTVEIWNSYK